MEASPVPTNAIGLPRPKTRWIRSVVDGPLRLAERALGLDRIEAMTKLVESGDRSVPGMERVLQVTGIRPKLAQGELERIPLTGPVVLCANHPYGVADGAVLLAVAMRRRTDVKILINGLLRRFDFIRDQCIFVDPFGGPESTRDNLAALREALEWVKAGHMLLAFPAGEVSAVHWGEWQPQDPPWSTIPARIALQSGARVVPAWFEGSNRGLFHAAGLVHPRLRTVLLPSEFVARCGSEIELRIGRPIHADGARVDAESLTRLVRGRSELLRSRIRVERPERVQDPIAPSMSTGDELAAELAALPSDSKLIAEGALELYLVRAAAIPKLMHEIGRSREIAFRAVGEGSGKAIDIDAFDSTYLQLVLWNRERRELVGGYRAGVVSEVTRDRGVDGLYTSTLFEYSPQLVDELRDAVELGRSFVCTAYQRQPLPLSMLWKGIAIFMLTNGHRRLFGPVSISNDYTSMSKELIMEFLEQHRMSAPFARLVTPRHPPARRSVANWTERERAEALSDISHVERLIDEIERGARAVPVLLRQYLRLNARLLALNVDPDFGDVIDALMLVDLKQVDERIIRHYGGDEAVALVRSRFGA